MKEVFYRIILFLIPYVLGLILSLLSYNNVNVIYNICLIFVVNICFCILLDKFKEL